MLTLTSGGQILPANIGPDQQSGQMQSAVRDKQNPVTVCSDKNTDLKEAAKSKMESLVSKIEITKKL